VYPQHIVVALYTENLANGPHLEPAGRRLKSHDLVTRATRFNGLYDFGLFWGSAGASGAQWGGAPFFPPGLRAPR
jgi:hypothetical protein